MGRVLTRWRLLVVPLALLLAACSSNSSAHPSSPSASSGAQESGSPSSDSGGGSGAPGGAASGSGAAAASPTPTPVSTQPAAVQPAYNVRELIAAARETFPGLDTCDSYGTDSFKCPFTPRLKAYLLKSHKDICRCVNPSVFTPPEKITAEVTAAGGVAHVSIGAKYDLLFATSGNLYLVDDEYCSGQGPSSSIYVSNKHC